MNKGAQICKDKKIDVLLAVWGGSTIDATKFIGAAAYYDGDAWDILTSKAPITNCLPIITVLTLAATGSEMDAGGVISNLYTKDKIGLMHSMLLPKVSFLDPRLTYTVNAYQTACGSADIISHIREVYFNLDQDLYMLDFVTALIGDLPRQKNSMFSYIKYTIFAYISHALKRVFRGNLK